MLKCSRIFKYVPSYKLALIGGIGTIQDTKNLFRRLRRKMITKVIILLSHQGKLEMWIDMFQMGHLPLKPAINISPPVPEEYEIRVIVWNTEDVPLVDSHFLTGEKCSDIYVKGYIIVNIEHCRRSDAF